MQFSTSQEIAAPRDTVFAEITDFDSFERQVLRAGGSVTRSGDPGAGARWSGTFDFRGTRRPVSAEVADWSPPEGYRVAALSGGLSARIDLHCAAIDESRTRLDVSIVLTPKTLAAKVLVNSLKLMRQQIGHRLHRRVGDFAEGVAFRASKANGGRV